MGDEPSAIAQPDLEAQVIAGDFKSLLDRTGIQEPDARLVETCVALHNSHRLDFLEAMTPSSLTQLEPWQQWQAFGLIKLVLPKLDATVIDMLAFQTRMLGPVGQAHEYDLRAAFELWCGAANERSTEVIALAEQSSAPAIANLCVALVAPGQARQARRLARLYTDDRRRQALNALARTQHLAKDEREETLRLLADLLDKAHADDLLDALVARILADAIIPAEKPITQASFDLLAQALAQGGELVLDQAARTFMFGSEEVLSPDVLTLFLKSFQGVTQANAGTVENIGMGLRKLTKDDRLPQALAFITLMVGRDEAPFTLKAFESVLRDMALGTGERLHRAVIGWLNQGQPRICFQLSGLLQALQMAKSPWSVNFPALGLTDLEIYFICRRASGYLLAEEIVAASLVISALRTADADLAAALTRLLVDPLLMNYGGELRQFLAAIGEDDPAHRHVISALAQSDAYREGLGVGMAAEFEVSSERRQLSHYLRSDQMRTASQAAQKDSILDGLIARQYILHGNRTSTWIKGPNGQRKWMDNDMARHGFTYELPRQDVLDPVGLQRHLYDLRHRKLAQ